MNEIQQIKQTAQKEARKNPKLAASIMESARLHLSKIAAGESPHHVQELFLGHLDELKGTT